MHLLSLRFFSCNNVCQSHSCRKRRLGRTNLIPPLLHHGVNIWEIYFCFAVIGVDGAFPPSPTKNNLGLEREKNPPRWFTVERRKHSFPGLLREKDRWTVLSFSKLHFSNISHSFAAFAVANCYVSSSSCLSKGSPHFAPPTPRARVFFCCRCIFGPPHHFPNIKLDFSRRDKGILLVVLFVVGSACRRTPGGDFARH